MKKCTKCGEFKPLEEFYNNQRGKRCWCISCCGGTGEHPRNGASIHPGLYSTWSDMKQRIFNPSCNNYPNYGGRGISVYDEWLDYKSFAEWGLDNGWQAGLTIDRIDNDGNYEPDNCQWITKSENTRKRYVG